MLHYIIQTIAFQLFFLIIYDAFLKKETFFNWNRTYLLITAFLSIVLPFIKIQKFKNVVPEEFVMTFPEVSIGEFTQGNTNLATQAVVTEASKFQWSWSFVFYLGLSIALCVFLVKLIKIGLLIYRNPKQWRGNLRIVTLIKTSTAFSFFYYVFLGEEIKTEDQPTILKHEAVHVNQKHTLDLLFFEILRILFWFNPLVYMYQNRISSLHEYIADAEAVKFQSKSDYYQDLLNQIFETENVSFINAFYKKSLIKKRIAMLSRTKSKQSNIVKYAILIPLVFGMLLYTSSNAQDVKKAEISQNDLIIQEFTDQELKDKYYAEMLELYASGNADEILKDAKNVREKYLNSREEYYRFQANMNVLFDKMSETYTGDKNSLQEKINKTYAEYLEWKKTDKAKEIWENNTSDGMLKLIVNKLGSLTDEEQKRYDGLWKLLNNDDYFHTLIVSDGLGFTKVEELESNRKVKENTNTALKVNEVQDLKEVPFAKVEEVPTLPNCENLTTQEEKRKCISNAITKHVQQNFNIDLAGNKGLLGKQRISVLFKIDTKGNVVGVRSRAPHPDLETEAVRVINTLPKFTPGKQNGIKVIVTYSLPIIFEVANKKPSQKVEKYQQKVKKLKTKIEAQKDKQEKNSNTEVSFAEIDQVPSHTSCENLETNEERKKCFSDLIISYIQKNFNTNLANDLKLTGRQRISAIFKIDTLGNVTEIRVRAPHPSLEDEAKRVISALPQFIPGEHNGKKVIVPYSLPIVFEVAENKSGDKENIIPFAVIDKVPIYKSCENLSTNDKQKQCVSDEVTKFVVKNLKTNLAKELGLIGKQQVFVIFKIDEEGNVFGVRSRSSNQKLEEEGKRVISMLPKFIPGEHKGKKVKVAYSIPIIFKAN